MSSDILSFPTWIVLPGMIYEYFHYDPHNILQVLSCVPISILECFSSHSVPFSQPFFLLNECHLHQILPVFCVANSQVTFRVGFLVLVLHILKVKILFYQSKLPSPFLPRHPHIVKAVVVFFAYY